MEIFYHPLFTTWFKRLIADDIEIAGEIQALLSALEEYGIDLGGPESLPLVTSTLGLRELRRSPATDVTPYAEGPPILRVIYGFVRTESGKLVALVLLGGEKTELGNAWYPRSIGESERRLVAWAAQEGWTIYH